MNALLQDVRYAVRNFLKSPGFTVVVVVSIALGIAANSTVFSIVNGLLFGALPVREPERLVVFNESESISYADFCDYRDGSQGVFEGVAAHFPVLPASIAGGGAPERIWGQTATGNFFSVSGVDFALGRGFRPEEDSAIGREPVVVLSQGLWRRRFGADPGVLGKRVILNGMPFTVIGVTRSGFQGVDRGLTPEFWVPLSMTESVMPDLGKEPGLRTSHTHQWLMVNARLKPGVTREQAAAAMNVIKHRIDAEFRKDDKHPRPMRLDPAGTLSGEVRRFAVGLMAVLMVVVAAVLMIACANVANLLLARATARHKEMGIRLAIGAGRMRLVRQLLTESILLSALGALAALALTWFAARALSTFELPLPLPIAFDFMPDARVFTFTTALAIATGILFGLAPAVRATRPDLVSALREQGSSMGLFRRFGLRNVLVVVQVALSFVLLVAAGLFLRSLRSATAIDVGFKTDHLLMMTVDPKLNHYSEERGREFLRNLRQRVQSMPGVVSVSYLDSIPLSIGGASSQSTNPSIREGKPVNTDIYRVGERFFDTIGLPLMRGREFRLGTDTGKTAIVNATLAKNLFGGADPIGRAMKLDRDEYTIVGIAADSKSRTLGEGPASIVYLFLEAQPNEVLSFFGTSVLVKTAVPPSALLQKVRDQIGALDPNLAVFSAQTMQEHIDTALLVPKICAMLLGIFGAVGLTLATVGLYGVMSYAARSRTREIGIRMALGASAGSVLRLVAARGLVLAAVGLAIGSGIAYALSQFTASLLYGASPTDPLTYAVVSSILIAVAMLAVFAPARRASSIDPMRALHYE